MGEIYLKIKLLAYAYLLFTSTLNSFVQSLCPSGYTYYSATNGCYKVVSSTGVTWYAARDSCASEGSWLVTIDSQTEQDLVYAMVPNTNTWIGLYEFSLPTKDSSKFKFVHLSTSTYSHWISNQPDGDDATGNNCAHMWNAGFTFCPTCNAYGFWNDLSCSATIIPTYICENSNSVGAGCPNGFVYYSGTGGCYMAVQSLVTWYDAQAACLANNAWLVTINNQVENTYVASLLGGYNGWIGFYQYSLPSANANYYRWTHPCSTSYVNFHPGEPNGNDPGGSNCGQIWFTSTAGTTSGTWDDLWCYSTLHYVCESDLTPFTSCSSGYYYCGPYTYSGSTSSGSCLQCNQGSYKSTNAIGDCTLCAAGSYNPSTGRTTSGSCLTCEMGKYNPNTGLSSCFQCSAGTYNGNTGSTSIGSCTSCGVGTYSANAGASACTPCGQGTYNVNTGSNSVAACTLCGQGTYNVNTGSVSVAACTPCGQGTYNINTGSTTASACTPCGQGKYNINTGSTSVAACSLCGQGTYNINTGSISAAACTPCGKGTYNVNTGSVSSSACTPCGQGTYNVNTGSISSSACTSCGQGKYNTNTGSIAESSCASCGQGTYNVNTGSISSSACTLCGQGTYNTNTGSISASACTPCGQGKYNTNTGSIAESACTSCGQGTYNVNTGSVSVAACTLCDQGKYNTNTGSITVAACINCGPGTYNVNTGSVSSSACTLCGPGKYNTNSGSKAESACALCVPGKYNINSGSTSALACLDCDAGKYNPDYGSISSSACIPCAVNHYGNTTGLYSCDHCPIRYFSYVGATICYPDPTSQPSFCPSLQPSRQPSCQPSHQPSEQPTSQPTTQPTKTPSTQPSLQPSQQPTSNPTLQPSNQPTSQPSNQPSSRPSNQPSQQPTTIPSSQPTDQPSIIPSKQPSMKPSHQPSCQPFNQPSCQPIDEPSSQPSLQPSLQPIVEPSTQPTVIPTIIPSENPTFAPSIQPSCQPFMCPSLQPFTQPTSTPTIPPSFQPSHFPTSQPSSLPLSLLSLQPTAYPSTQPNQEPSKQPFVSSPSVMPSLFPSGIPTVIPVMFPSNKPSQIPTTKPSFLPTGHPTLCPTCFPTTKPIDSPSLIPTSYPSNIPSIQLWIYPTSFPSIRPSHQPTSTPSYNPTCYPSSIPSCYPNSQPTTNPSILPSYNPTVLPTYKPTQNPTSEPSINPFVEPSSQPTIIPQEAPTSTPSTQPKTKPSLQPSLQPIITPSKVPIVLHPSIQPFSKPSNNPSINPSTQSLSFPTNTPTRSPNIFPTSSPSLHPKSRPSAYPSQIKTTILFNPAPNISAISVLSYNSSSSVLVKVILGNLFSSIVYCAGFSVNSKGLESIPKSNFDVMSNNYFSLSNNGQANVLISGLVPSSTYDIYCTTVSLMGIALNINFVRKNKVRVLTSCCKIISYSITQPSVTMGSINFNYINMIIANLPSHSLILQFELISVSSKVNNFTTIDSKLTYLSPNHVFVNYNDPSPISIGLVFIAGSIGDYSLQISLNGSSANEYSIINPSNNILNVLRSNDLGPPTPSALSAVFNNDGSYIIVTFDSSTDKGGFYSKFTCSDLLSFVGTSSSTCLWMSLKQIYVYPMYKPTNVSELIVPGSIMNILPNKIKAGCEFNSTLDCSHLPFIKMQNLTVQASKSSLVPIVSVSAPTTISSCNNLVLDLTSSVGDGGRPWNRVFFEVSNSGNGNVSDIKMFLNSNYKVHPPTPIPSEYLVSGQTYAFKIYLTNFLGVTGYGKHLVYVGDASNASPMLSIVGQTNRIVYPYSSLILVSSAYTINCKGVISYENLTFVWTVAESNGGNYLKSNIQSESQNGAIFKLSPFKLVSNRQYIMDLKVIYSSGVQKFDSSMEVNIKVIPANIVAIIVDGSLKRVTVGDTNSVDASTSYDENSQIRSNNTNLSFLWSCQQISPLFSLQCPLNILSLLSKSMLTFNTSLSSLQTTTRLTVSVSDATRISSVYIDVIVVDEKVSQLSISSTTNSFSSVSINQKVTLVGSMKLVEACQAKWSIDSKSIDLSQISLTPTSAMFAMSSSLDSTRTFYLSLRPYALAGNTNYVFTLSCGKSQNSVTVTTNAGPIPGALSINPNSGLELSTIYSFSALQWTDPDLPLRYQFGFVSETSLVNLVIISISELTYTTTRLPAGPKETNFMINCTLNVYDSNMATTFINVLTTVQPVNISSKLDLMSELLSSLSTGSINDKTNLVSTASAALNTVDCSTASNCSALNRQPCLKTQQTCSSCLNGFIGETKDSNSPCISIVESSNIIDPRSSHYCFSDSDCGIFSFCNSTSKICEVRSQTCPGDCLGRGFCYFGDINTGKHLDKCKVDDVTCEAICHCTNSYTGISCEMSLDELKKRQVIRSQLVSTLYGLTANDDISVENLVAWSTSLSSCSQNQFELSYETAKVSEKIAENILNSAADLNMDRPDDLIGILQSIDAVTSVERYNYNPNNLNNIATDKISYNNYSASRIVTIIAKYSDLVSSGMVFGQEPVSSVYRNFRISTTLTMIGGSNANIHEVSTTQTPFESLKNVQKSSTSLYSNKNNDSSDVSLVAIGIIETLAKSYGSISQNIKSNPIRIKLSGANNSLINSLLSEISFTLIHNNIQEHNSNQFMNKTMNFTTLCYGEKDFSIHQYICSDTGYVISRNCSGKFLKFLDICPHYNPSCNTINITTGSLQHNTFCSITNYSITSTTCTCVLNNNQKTRLLSTSFDSILDSSGISTVVDASEYISEDFFETALTVIPGDNPSAIFHQIYITVAMLSCLWGLGLLIMIYYFFQGRKSKINDVKRVDLPIKNTKNKGHIQKQLFSYIDSFFPAVYSHTSMIDSLKQEILDRHLYFSLFSNNLNFRTDSSRYLKLFKLLTIQTMMIFLLALLYDIQSPSDDGSCVAFLTEDTCLMRKRLLDKSTAYCSWDTGSCVYSDAPDSIKSFFFIIIVSSIVTSILTTPIELLIKIIDSPTEKIAFKTSSVKSLSMTRQLSRVSMKSKSKVYDISEKISLARHQTVVHKLNSTKTKRKKSIYPLSNETLMEHLSIFFTEILSNRRFLLSRNSEFVDEYSYLWGVELLDNHDLTLFTLNEDTKNNIQLSLLELNKIVENINLRLGKQASEQQIGFKIIHYFLLDLIGYKTSIGKIFNNKFEEDFQVITVASFFKQMMAVCVIIGLNAIFIYYTILKSYTKGLNWQNDFMNAVITQFFVEVFFNTTLECFWVNFIIPLLLRDEVNKVKETIRDTITNYIQDSDYEYKLDTPSYLFISTQLALTNPDILESKIVLSYHSYLPGAISKSWTKKQNNFKANQNPHYLVTLIWILFQILRYSASIPYFYQRILIRFLQPLLLSGVIIFWYFVISHPILISVISIILGIIILYFLYRYFRNRNILNGKNIIAPIEPSFDFDDNNNEDSFDDHSLSTDAPDNDNNNNDNYSIYYSDEKHSSRIESSHESDERNSEDRSIEEQQQQQDDELELSNNSHYNSSQYTEYNDNNDSNNNNNYDGYYNDYNRYNRYDNSDSYDEQYDGVSNNYSQRSQVDYYEPDPYISNSDTDTDDNNNNNNRVYESN